MAATILMSGIPANAMPAKAAAILRAKHADAQRRPLHSTMMARLFAGTVLQNGLPNIRRSHDYPHPRPGTDMTKGLTLPVAVARLERA